MKPLRQLAFVLAMALAAPLARAAPARLSHEGTWQGDAIAWEVQWQRPGGLHALRFVAPLPADTRVVDLPAGSHLLRDAEGRLVGMEVEGLQPLGTVTLIVPQDLDDDALLAPVVAGEGIQRVVLHGVRFRPDPSTGIEEHVEYWALPGVDAHVRREFERQWKDDGGRRARASRRPLYLTSAEMPATGLPGTLRREGDIPPMVVPALGGVVLLLGAVGLKLHRSLDRQAKEERNQAYIDKNFGVKPPKAAT